MEFRKMVMISLYARQQKRHRCIEQSFGLWEKARVEWYGRMALKHVNYHMWNESPVQVWWYRVLGAGALGWPRGMGWGARWEGGSGWGTYVHPWWIHVKCMEKPIQYYKVKKLKKKVSATPTSSLYEAIFLEALVIGLVKLNRPWKWSLCLKELTLLISSKKTYKPKL